MDIGILAVTSLCLTPLPRELSPGLPPGCPPARKLLGAFVPGQGDGHFPRPAPSPSFLQASCGASCLHGCRSAGKTSWAGARKPRGRLHLRPQRPVFRDLHGPDHSPHTGVRRGQAGSTHPQSLPSPEARSSPPGDGLLQVPRLLLVLLHLSPHVLIPLRGRRRRPLQQPAFPQRLGLGQWAPRSKSGSGSGEGLSWDWNQDGGHLSPPAPSP